MPADRVQMIFECAVQSIGGCEPTKTGDSRQIIGLLGNFMGLRIMDHLQAMFDHPQKLIGLGQFIPLDSLDPVVLHQMIKCFQSCFAA